MHQTAEYIGKIMQMISLIILYILFVILGLLISKYFFIGIPIVFLILYIFIPFINYTKKSKIDYEERKIRQKMRDF